MWNASLFAKTNFRHIDLVDVTMWKTGFLWRGCCCQTHCSGYFTHDHKGMVPKRGIAQRAVFVWTRTGTEMATSYKRVAIFPVSRWRTAAGHLCLERQRKAVRCCRPQNHFQRRMIHRIPRVQKSVWTHWKSVLKSLNYKPWCSVCDYNT